jgi:hypothetical protein
MSDVTLTVYESTTDGLDLTGNATGVVTANSYFMPNSGREKLHVFNVTGSTCAVVAVTQETRDGNPVADKSVSVPTAKNYELGPYDPKIYNNQDGRVKFTFDQTVGIIAVRS